jgi:hypothetical protein
MAVRWRFGGTANCLIDEHRMAIMLAAGVSVHLEQMRSRLLNYAAARLAARAARAFAKFAISAALRAGDSLFFAGVFFTCFLRLVED